MKDVVWTRQSNGMRVQRLQRAGPPAHMHCSGATELRQLRHVHALGKPLHTLMLLPSTQMEKGASWHHSMRWSLHTKIQKIKNMTRVIRGLHESDARGHLERMLASQESPQSNYWRRTLLPNGSITCIEGVIQ